VRVAGEIPSFRVSRSGAIPSGWSGLWTRNRPELVRRDRQPLACALLSRRAALLTSAAIGT
jgi:hypothetical protein